MSYWTFWGIKFSSELPTRSRDLPIGSWGVVFSVGGAIFVSLSGMMLPVHLTVINYKIFGIKFSSLLSKCSHPGLPLGH